MGTYVENPNIKVDWTQYAEHAAERMQQRGMTQELVNNIVENGEIVERITQIINDWDPIGFFPMAPKDEYINEIKKISEFPKAHVTMARIRGGIRGKMLA